MFFLQQALDVVVELMVAEGAHVPQPGPVAREPRGRQLRLQGVIVQTVELQREKERLGGQVGHLLLHALEKAAGLRVRDMAGIVQERVAHQPAKRLVDRLVGFDRRAQFAARKL